ncbi:hypothetical protein Ptr902_08327 [Pyrenophora tritici-repentis]|nr:hypothetical protein Ptr902_08327 [Pyrenophora tritici-repentis]
MIYFLNGIGPHGRTSLHSLTIFPPYPVRHPGNGANAQAEKCLELLAECKKLAFLSLSIPLWEIFNNSDSNRIALAAFLVCGEPLQVGLIDELVGTLHGMPKLKYASVWVVNVPRSIGHHLWWQLKGADDFYTFGFTGARADRFIFEISNLLKARKSVEFETMVA